MAEKVHFLKKNKWLALCLYNFDISSDSYRFVFLSILYL